MPTNTPKVGKYTVDSASGFVGIKPVKDCYFADFRNTSGGAVAIRSDPTDANTELVLQAGESYPFRVDKNQPAFDPQNNLIYAKMVAGVGTIQLICV